MIYITGDTHGKIDIGKLYSIGDRITDNDYLVICGDAGLYWDGAISDEETKKLLLNIVPKGTILWLDGNHENFDLIDKLPIDECFGGKVQFTDKRIIHLMRGEVYTIEDKTFFCFGGGHSIDKMYRTEGISWWSREMPNKEEYENGKRNLERYNNKVDYILTHTAPRFICRKLVSNMFPGEEELQDYLTDIAYNTEFKEWYFGHWHMDKTIDNRYHALYNLIKSIPS